MLTLFLFNVLFLNISNVYLHQVHCYITYLERWRDWPYETLATYFMKGANSDSQCEKDKFKGFPFLPTF
jgi:hypothetical protein